MNATSTLVAFGFAVASLTLACSGATKTEEIADDPASTEGSVTAPGKPAKPSDKPATDNGTNSTPAADDKKTDPAPESTDPDEDPTDTVPTQTGVNRVSINEHCCYGAQYFKCPDATACFGGFDVDACLSTCAGPASPCFSKCFEQEASAPAPKGCQAKAAPKGIDCANGNFEF